MASRARGVDGYEPTDLGPMKAWAYNDQFRNSKLFAEYLNRLVTGRDMNVIITAASETGVGKTTLAVALAMMWDQNGWTHEKASVANPVKYDRKYDESAPGSVLILDEAEKAMDSRRGMTKENVNLTQSFATKRYRQVFSILTAPSKGWVDKRLGADAADYWIQCQQTDLGRIKGEAKVYRLAKNEHTNSEITPFVEYLRWPSLDGITEFEKLDERKREILETDSSGKTYYHKDEVEELVEQREKELRQDLRDEWITKLNHQSRLEQKEIGSLAGLSKGRVSQIANSD